MKKKLRVIISCFIVLSLIICLGIALFTCEGKHPYPYEEMKEKVAKVEIGFHNFDSSTEIFKELTNEEIIEFLIVLSEIHFDYSIGDPSASVGNVFAIYYKDNTSELLSSNGSSIYNGNGKRTGGRNIYCSKEDFNDLLSKFTEIE